MADTSAELARGVAAVLAAVAATAEAGGCIFWRHNIESQDCPSMVRARVRVCTQFKTAICCT